MSKTQKTIDVEVCDFCSKEATPTWVCADCGRDACIACGNDWTVRRSHPTVFGPHFNSFNSISLGAGYSLPEYSGFLCSLCEKSDLPRLLAKAGLREGEYRYAKSGT
jgi:hypothetical protein